MSKNECKIDFVNNWDLLYQGAESKVYSGIHANRECIAKYRFPKKFRHPLLDKKLTKERTKRERKMIEKIADKSDILGTYMPKVLWSNDSTIIMTKVNCKQNVYDYITEHNLESDSKEMEILASAIGRCVAELHNISIVHGDLTTSNLLMVYPSDLQPNKRLCLEKQKEDNQDDIETETCPYLIIPIDFGLATGSNHSEERAVDLFVLERALLVSHFSNSFIFSRILDVYLESINETNCVPPGKHKIIERYNEVRSRGRKADLKDGYSG